MDRDGQEKSEVFYLFIETEEWADDDDSAGESERVYLGTVEGTEAIAASAAEAIGGLLAEDDWPPAGPNAEQRIDWEPASEMGKVACRIADAEIERRQEDRYDPLHRVSCMIEEAESGGSVSTDTREAPEMAGGVWEALATTKSPDAKNNPEVLMVLDAMVKGPPGARDFLSIAKSTTVVRRDPRKVDGARKVVARVVKALHKYGMCDASGGSGKEVWKLNEKGRQLCLELGIRK